MILKTLLIVIVVDTAAAVICRIRICKIVNILKKVFNLPAKESNKLTSTLWPACNVSIKLLASLLNKKTIGMLMSSVPSPDIENKGLLADVVPLLLSTTMPPLAPAFSNIRAFSKRKNMTDFQRILHHARCLKITEKGLIQHCDGSELCLHSE